MVLTFLVLFIAEGSCTALREKEAVPDAHFLCGSRHASLYDLAAGALLGANVFIIRGGKGYLKGRKK